MRRADLVVGQCFLAVAVLTAALDLNAAQWDTIADGRAVIPEALSQRLLFETDRPLVVPGADGWWLLGDPGISHRRLIARFPRNDTTPAAATVVADGYRFDAVELADGALAVMLHRDNNCFFDNDCDGVATLEVRNPDTSLRWSRHFDGPCSTPLSRQSELILACADRLMVLDQDGRTRQSRVLAGGSASTLPLLTRAGESLLLLRHNAADQALIDVIDENLRDRWRRQWPVPLKLIGTSASNAYFRERPADDFQYITRSFLGLRLADGELAMEQSVSGRVRAVVTSADQIYSLVSSGEEGRQQLLLTSAAGQRTFTTSEVGSEFEDLLALPNGVIAAGRIEDGARLVSFYSSGIVTGVQQFPLPAGRMRLSPVSVDTFALVNWPRIGRYPTLDLRSIYGESLSSRLEWVPVTSGTPGGRIDSEQRTSWVGGKVSFRVGDYLARTSFDNEAPALTIGQSTTDYAYRVLLGPTQVGNHFCVASAPGPSIPQPPNSGVTDLLCAPRRGSDGEARVSLTLPGVWPYGIALGESALGTPKLLSSVVALDMPLFVTEVGFDGTSMTRAGSILGEPARAYLEPDLSGLVGSSVIDADGNERFQLPVSDDYVLASWRLSDGGWLLQTTPRPPNYSRDLNFVRFDVDGNRQWQRAESAPVGPRPTVRAIEHGSALVIEYSPPLGSYDDQPGPGETGRRLWLDKANGALLAAPQSLKDAQSDLQLLSLDPEQGAAGLWRLIGAGQGMLAQSLTAGTHPYWLDCAMSECAIEAQALGMDGRALFKLSGNRAQGFHNQLVSVALDDVALGGAAPGDPAANGRWHDQDSLFGGLLVTRDPTTRMPLRLWFGEAGSTDDGQPLARWWSLKESGRVGAVIEHQIDFTAQVASAGGDPSTLANLQPLMNGELYLHQVFDRRMLGELNAERAKVSHHHLQRRAESARTTTYFADANQWIAIDTVGGEGVWGRPDGGWYRLRQQSGERWVISAEIRSSNIRGADQLSERREDLAVGQLRLGRCGDLQWRVLNSLVSGDRQFSDALRAMNYTTGESCR
ncbi:MAG: hypothetical protein KDI71_11215 [Xanthomonadales bacterium]|nr:hypothetical protein [Xanthomonadales bacterium]